MREDIRRLYHDPPETPREEMWQAIEARIRAERRPAASDPVDLDAVRRARRGRPAVRRWAAAAAVLVLGIALGRVTAPEGSAPVASTDVEEGAPSAPEGVRPEATGLDYAAIRHLDRSESLLVMVRADAREGRIDPTVAPWARSLLAETRLLIDARGGADPTLDGLLGELELVLTQIVGVTEASDEGRRRTELELAIGGMEEREVLTRIRAAVPAGMSSE